MTHDGLGRKTAVNDGATETRRHNSVNELTDRTPSGGTQTNLSYDATGNLTQ